MGVKISARGIIVLLVIAGLGLLAGLRLYSAGIGRGKTPTIPPEAQSAPVEQQEAQYVEITSAPRDFFAESRLERERIRSRQMELLQAIAESKDSSPQAKAGAQAEMLALTGRMEKEARVEALIQSRGFARVLVFLGEESCDVIVETDGLTPLGARQIGDIVTRVCGLPPEKVTIAEHKS
ncbi:MAG TPA: SpoIIIAH-like family protein [Firmicutes bacterium]|nr:SpoIIIAH-like family protein [Bacillota bacterium]